LAAGFLPGFLAAGLRAARAGGFLLVPLDFFLRLVAIVTSCRATAAATPDPAVVGRADDTHSAAVDNRAVVPRS
jgi:hypothetical protein